MKFLKGKKTFIVVAVFVVLVALGLVLKVAVPEWVYAILGALGLGGLRAAVTTISGNRGWKTYLAALSVAVVAVLNALGVNLPYETVFMALGALGVVGVRDALRGVEPAK